MLHQYKEGIGKLIPLILNTANVSWDLITPQLQRNFILRKNISLGRPKLLSSYYNKDGVANRIEGVGDHIWSCNKKRRKVHLREEMSWEAQESPGSWRGEEVQPNNSVIFWNIIWNTKCLFYCLVPWESNVYFKLRWIWERSPRKEPELDLSRFL